MVFGKSYQPLARCFVAPIGVCESLGQNVAGTDIKNLPTGGFYQVEVRGFSRQCFKHHREFHFSALGQDELLIGHDERAALSRPLRHLLSHGKTPVAHLQIGRRCHPDPMVGPKADMESNLRAVVAQCHLGYAEHVAVRIVTANRLLPNFVGCLCLCDQCEK